MSAGRTTWLIAAEAAPWRAPLTAQLASHGMAVELVAEAQADSWRRTGAMPEVRGLPQLLVVPVEAARADDWALLRLLERAPVWRRVPRVVVGQIAMLDVRTDDADGIQAEQQAEVLGRYAVQGHEHERRTGDVGEHAALRQAARQRIALESSM